jgi:uncharacterized protein
MISIGTVSIRWAIVGCCALVLGVSSINPGPARSADHTDGLKEMSAALNGKPERKRDAVLLWRKAAWQSNDFLSQISLGYVYSDEDRAPSRIGGVTGEAPHFRDRIEAYVWYFIASQNEGFARYLFMERGRARVNQWLNEAYKSQARLFLGMTSAEREVARNRIIYILGCRGVDGFLQLAALHRESWAIERRKKELETTKDDTSARVRNLNELLERLRWASVEMLQGRSSNESSVKDKIALESGSVFSHDNLMAMMYLYLAKSRGSNLAPILLEDARREFSQGLDAGIQTEDVVKLMQQVESDARRWIPPYEFYPRGVGMYPHSDECVLSATEERQLKSISRYVAADEIKQALWFLQFLHGSRDQWDGEYVRGVGDFQESLSFERTGRLTDAQILRLIRMAAVSGHTPSQVRLGVLYAKGQAVRAEYERAAKWFDAAAKQRDAQAMFYLGELIKKNYVIREQDATASSALSYYVQSFAAGGPTRSRFEELLTLGPCPGCSAPAPVRYENKLNNLPTVPKRVKPAKIPLDPVKSPTPPEPGAADKTSTDQSEPQPN